MVNHESFADQARIICQLYDEADHVLEDYGPKESDRFEQLLNQIENKCQRLIEDFEELGADPEKQTILKVTKGRVYSSLKTLQGYKDLYEGKPVPMSFSPHSSNSFRAVVVDMKKLFTGFFMKERDRSQRCDPPT